MKTEDLFTRLLTLLHDRVPDSLQSWSQAMLAELAVIGGFWPRLQWSMGSAIALASAWLRYASEQVPGEVRRLDVSLIAAYHFLFSAALIGLLSWQLPQVTESWKVAVPVLVMSYAVAAVPGVLGFGLILGDDAARIGTVIFSIAHLLLGVEFIRQGTAVHPQLTWARIAADALIIFVLSRRAVRRHFQMSPLALHLADESLAPCRD